MRIYTLNVLLILSAVMLTKIACGGGPQLSSNTKANAQPELARGPSIEAYVKDELAKAMPTTSVASMPKVTGSTPKQHLHRHRTT